ncbi:MAG: ExbD/TolR family protein [Candidatus Eisenbacteria bacterium]|nr:biopolymer transporter ExbD [Candidatus Eisenbacteria bacterium]
MSLRIPRGPRVPATIPTASMADIAFLLLIFFLTSSLFRLQERVAVDLPEAESGVRASREEGIRLWIDRAGVVTIGERPVAIDEVGPALERALAADPGLTLALQIDRDVPYATVDRLLREIRAVRVRNVTFGSRPPEP